MLLRKIAMFGRGRSLLSKLSLEPVTSICQRSVGASCLSHRADYSHPASQFSSFQLASKVLQRPSLPSSYCTGLSSVLSSNNQLVQTNCILEHSSRCLYSQCNAFRTTGSNPLKKSCVAEYHVTSSQRQVVNDDDMSGSQEGWFSKHKMRLKSAPPAALVLGFSGLIPFIMPAAYSIITFSCGPQVAFAQVAYGACILSFLGGVRWGFAIAPDETPTSMSLVTSVIPSLVAWTGLSMPIQPGLVCIITGLALAGIIDSRFKSFPPWFRSLRFLLTTFAILSVSITFGFSILYPPPEPVHGYNFTKLIKIAQIIVQD